MSIRTGTTVTGGLTIGYRETGTGNPVVLLHALGSQASTWDTFATALAGQGRRAIAPDFRGHGTTSMTDEYSLELMVTDLLGFLDARGLPRVDLIGHSMGGHVAQLFAAGHPDRVRRLVIEEAAPPPHTAADPPPPEPPAEPPGPVGFDWRLVRPVLSRLRTPDPAWWASLASITAPTLLIAGGPSSPVAQERIHEAAAAVPGARIAEIPAGHHVHREAPAEFAEAVLEFLD